MSDKPIMIQHTGSARTRTWLIRIAIAGFVCLAAAVALGYYGWTVRSEREATSGKLKQAKKVAAKCASGLAGEKKASTDLKGKLNKCTIERLKLDEKQRKIAISMAGMAKDLDTTRKELDELRKKREETARRLAAFKDLTSRFRKMINSGKLNVVVRRGRMMVKLPASVLFPSGSADLSRDGELALMEVAIVLRGYPKRQFMVAGHTDNRPLESSSKSRFRNNWELSTGRAVRVVQFLVEAKLKPTNLVAAGYAEFDPVGDNRTRKGRQENRRIEIILLPDLEEMPSIPK